MSILHAAVLKKVIKHEANSPPGQSNTTILATLAEDIKKPFKSMFYTTINSTRLNLHNFDLFYS